MSFRSKGLVLAMEDDAPVVQVEINAENEVPAEVEADAAELSEQAGEVEDLVTAVEEAEQDAATLDRMAGVMEESADKGEGLDETAAEIAEVAVEAICGRLGIRTYGRAMPALESFGSRGSRVSATRISVEGIKEWITTTWEAIKKAFKDMWAKVKAFFEKFFVANERLKEAAKKMLENIGSVGDTPKAAAFEDKGIASQFPHLKVFDKTAVIKELDVHKGVVDSTLAFVGGLEGAVTEVNKAVEAALKVEGDARKAEAPKVQAAVEKFITDTTTGVKNGFTSALPAVVKGSKASGEKGVYSPVLAGGQVIALSQVNSGDESKTGSHFSATVIPASADALRNVGNISLKTLDKGSMTEILKKVIELCDVNTQLRTKSNAIGNIEKKFDSVVNTALKAAENLDSESKANEGTKEVITAAKNGMSGVGRAAGVLATAVPKLSVQAGKAALGYVSKSIAQYKK